MKRREFVSLLAAAATGWPRAAAAQEPARARRVGVLLGYVDGDEEALLRLATLRRVLGDRGWTDNRNIRFDYRFSGNTPEKLRADAKALVDTAPDVIVVQGNRPLTLLKEATRTIPIVFAQVADPVGGGLINNLAQPGGNATGFTNFEASMGGKWMEVLKDIVPPIGQVVVMFHPDTAANVAYWHAAETAAQSLGLTATAAGVQDAAGIERAFVAMAGSRSGLVVMPHDVTTANRDLIVDLAGRYRVPAVYAYRFFVR